MQCWYMEGETQSVRNAALVHGGRETECEECSVGTWRERDRV